MVSLIANRVQCVTKPCMVFLLMIQFTQCQPTCDPAKYEINGECCPLCSPGTRVFRRCTKYTSTSCLPCIGLSFTDKPNNLRKCMACSTCDKGFHLKILKKCTASSDAVCGVLEGNYCTDLHGGGCRAAQKHTTCTPGQFIKHPGTDITDTVCANCPENSYSDGSSNICTPHTDCQAKGLSTVKVGSRVSDTECGDNSHVHVISGIIAAAVVIAIIAAAATYVLKYQKRTCLSKGDSSRISDAKMTRVSEETKKRNSDQEQVYMAEET